jgi:hypothetical protein
MRRRAFRGVLLTTTVIGALAPGVAPEQEFFALPGWWGMVMLHQPDFETERPLAPHFGTTRMSEGSGSGRVHFASAQLDGKGTVNANLGEPWFVRLAAVPVTV